MSETNTLRILREGTCTACREKDARIAELEAERAKLLHAIHRDSGGMDQRADDGRREIMGCQSWQPLREKGRNSR